MLIYSHKHEQNVNLDAKRKKETPVTGKVYLWTGINTSSPGSSPDGLHPFWKCLGTTHHIPRTPSKNSTNAYFFNLSWDVVPVRLGCMGTSVFCHSFHEDIKHCMHIYVCSSYALMYACYDKIVLF